MFRLWGWDQLLNFAFDLWFQSPKGIAEVRVVVLDFE
jgi:hypothetical protein